MKFENYKLPNNFKVVLYKMPSVETVSIRVDIRNGGIFENEKNAGISHFVEHWIHQGNEKFSDYTEFTTYLEKLGMYQNGATENYKTFFYIKSPSDKLEEAFQSLYELVIKPTFPAHRKEHVKEIVLNEYYDHWRHPEAKFWRKVFENRFTDKTALLNDTLGTPESISSITREDTIEWYKKFYTAGNMLLTIVGNFDEEIVKRLIHKTYEALPQSETIQFPEFNNENYSSFLIYAEPEERDQLEFTISFPAFGWKNKLRESIILSLIETNLAGGGYSRLTQILREQNNLVYGVSPAGWSIPDRGVVGFHGVTQRKNLKKVVELLTTELKNISQKPFTKEEVQIGKNLQISHRVFSAETPEGIGTQLINFAFWDEEIFTMEMMVREMETISDDEVNKMAAQIFEFNNANFSILGKISDQEIKEIEYVLKSVKISR